VSSLFRNTLAQAVGGFSGMGYSFLLAPIMVDRLGLTLFGVWAVVGAIATYATVLDAGLTRALSRFVALYETRGDADAVRECVGLGFCAFTLIACLVLPAAWFSGPAVAEALGHVTGDEMSQILVASAVIFTVQGYSSVLQALPDGLRRMVPSNVALTAGNTVNFAASVATLLISRSLVPYAWANAGAATASALFMLVSARVVWGSRLASFPSRVRVREVLGFSVQSQVGWISDLINLQSDKIVIGVLVGARAAGTYQIASSVAGAIRAVGVISISAMIPSATSAIVEQGRDAIRRLVHHYLPLVLGVSLPLFAITAVTAPFLFTVWIGHPVHGAVAILIALNVAYAINIMTGVPSTISIADGRPGFVSRNSLQMATLNLALTIGLAPVLGLAGVVIGTVVAVSFFSGLFVVSFARSYRIDAGEVRDAIVPASLLSVAVAAPFVPIVVALRHLAVGRVSAGALLLAVVLGYVAVYWPLASRLRMLPERLLFGRFFSRTVAEGH
jgi:O-antigen/teichoic acid export membrane protein